VAADAAGDFVVVWQSVGQTGSSTVGIFAQRYSAAGAPLGGELPVNTVSYSTRPVVAMDSVGDFVVVWENTNDNIFARRYNALGIPLGAAFQVNPGTTIGFRP